MLSEQEARHVIAYVATAWHCAIKSIHMHRSFVAYIYHGSVCVYRYRKNIKDENIQRPIYSEQRKSDIDKLRAACRPSVCGQDRPAAVEVLRPRRLPGSGTSRGPTTTLGETRRPLLVPDQCVGAAVELEMERVGTLRVLR